MIFVLLLCGPPGFVVAKLCPHLSDFFQYFTTINHLISIRCHSVGKSTVALKVSQLIEQRNCSGERISIVSAILEFDKIGTDRGTFLCCRRINEVVNIVHNADIVN
jgi:hypothetical protein